MGALGPLLAAGFAAGGAALGARGVLRRSLPRPGLVRIAGLDDEVEILRDRWGVPHVYARTEHDLSFANGVVHAEDRLWQMELNRRAATGRLSELFGAATLGVDRFVRRVGLHRVAAEELRLLDEPTRVMLTAYVAGVNWAIEARPRPIELVLLRHHPAPWTELDTLAWAKLMAWGLSVNWDSEIARVRLLNKLGPALAAELEPLYPVGGWLSAHGEAIARAGGSLLESYAQLRELTGLSGLGGSNAWAVAPSRSASGAALFANDMHLAAQMPSVWYELSLEARDRRGDGLKVAGASLPGLPGVVVGHNGQIAWGYTASYVDVQDLYVERVHPEDRRRFARGDGWEQAQVVKEEIRVKGEPRWRSEEVVVSSNGPVITPLLDGIEETLSLRATPLEAGRTMAAGRRLLRARGWEEFREAMRDWTTPSLGVVYADRDGNVAFQLVGLTPKRGAGDGAAPSPGWDPRFAWRGFIPFEELPHRLNPPEGYVATANNQPMGDDYPYRIGVDWVDAYRVHRVVELLRARPKHTRESFQAIQLDVGSVAAREFVARVAGILDGEQPIDPLEREALRLLLAWDGTMATASAPPAIYALFRGRLLRLLYGQQLGELTELYLGAPPHDNTGGSSFAWRVSSKLNAALDDPDWPERRGHRGLTWRDLLLIALGEAVSQLRLAHGEEIGCWDWARIHRISFEHPLGRVKALRRLFNRGPYPVGGDADTPLQTGPSPSRIEDRVGWMPSYRIVVDFADVGTAVSMHTTGQSGQPGSRHYDDFLPMWLRGEYHRLLWERAEVEERLEAETRLLPTDELWPKP
ncbi:MAG TPA: penicillin acylase family protein [Chloroflexota bacterium]|nr:penicillin acylase family protein [Chloroflexota bacterium]